MVNTIENAVQFILSDNYLDSIVATNKWCEHGSNIIELFEDNDKLFEFSNTKMKKEILKKYIKEKLDEILINLEYENPKFLYRALYLDSKPKKEDFYGFFWSSREDTNPCYDIESQLDEYVLIIEYDKHIVNWIETLKSRMDYLYGDREQEYYLLEKNVKLFDYIILE